MGVWVTPTEAHPIGTWRYPRPFGFSYGDKDFLPKGGDILMLG